MASWPELWREHRLAILVLFTVALVARVVVLMQISASPYSEVTNIDSDSYLAWATEMATKSWLGDRGYYQSPLYAWYLAAFQKIFGPTTWPPRIGQIILGSFSPVLAYAIATRLFDRRAGWIAGIAVALYGPLILEEVTLSKTSLLVVTVLAAFALYLRYAPHANVRGLVASGFLFGVTVVGVAQWLLGFLALGALTMVMPRDADRRRRLIAAAAFTVTGIATIVPVAVWNTYHFGGLVLTSGGAGLNIYSGNNERASVVPASPQGLRDIPQFEEEDSRRLAEQGAGRPLNEAQVSRYWIGRALAFVTSQPGAYLQLLWRKIIATWNGYEIPDNYHYAFVRAHFVPVLYGTATFGLIAPLALVGFVRAFWRRRQLTALYVITFATLAPLLIFYVRSRYRIPAVPFLAMFAAIAALWVWDAVTARDGRRIAALATATVVAAVFVNHTYCEPPHHGFRAFCLGGDTWFDSEWLKLNAWYEARGDYDRALSYAQRARECTSPRNPGVAEFAIGTSASRAAVKLYDRGDPAGAEERAAVAEKAYESAIAERHRVGDANQNLILVLGLVGLDDRARGAATDALNRGEIDRARLNRIVASLQQQGRQSGADQVATVARH